MRIASKAAAFAMALTMSSAAVAQTAEPAVRFRIPSTVSPQTAAQLVDVYKLFSSTPLPTRKDSQTQAEWDQQAAAMEAGSAAMQNRVVDELGVTRTAGQLGGVPVLTLTPRHYKDNGTVLICIRGGAYVFFSARSSISTPALLANAGGYKVISIDYTLAPRGNWRSITDQVLSVWRALLAKGVKPQSVGIFGDSAGGGLTAGSLLKMRDKGLPLPGALFLSSPWADITQNGDTYETLKDADPVLPTPLTAAANAYAAPEDQKNPYVSPVYGNYSKPFPPTLIQGGTREVFLSNFIRQYQAIRRSGHEAVLDLYEGMPHVFQAIVWRSPEAQTALKREADFFHAHLKP